VARFDLFRVEEDYLLDVQANTLDDLNSRVVVPIQRPELAPKPGRRLNPAFIIEGQTYVMVTQFISAVPAIELRQPAGNLSHHRDDITAALDMLFQGY
jgi:toxin CcdB